MTLKKIIVPVMLLLCQFIQAQNDSIVQLQEVVITDTQLKDFSNSQQVQTLNDSVIQRNTSSLTTLLNYNTVIYFKENGLGMVSSPSFRGTTASQTAVLWNGININSQLNGQTDFNVLNTRDFGSISVRAGGGSVIYGSSAIGGSVHLNNEIDFKKGFSNNLYLNYGSYNTFGGNYKVQAATEKVSANVSITRNSSDNDYEYPGGRFKNDNGQYYNTSLSAGFAYKINEKNSLRLYSYAYDGDRHFSRTTVSRSRSKYHDTNTRNMLEWQGVYNRFTSKLKAAYLTEKYKYFEDYQRDNYSEGEVKTFIGRYDASYSFKNNMFLNAIIDYTQNNVEGSDIQHQIRRTGSGSLLIKHNPWTVFTYEMGVRKEITNIYDSPVLFSAGASYAVTPFYTLKVNGSRNFRNPTYNDLYWQGSGNPNLKPEHSYQAELGNNFTFKQLSLSLTGYYMDIKDMLRWVPAGSMWAPENVGRVHTYGAEVLLNWHRNFGGHRFELNSTYAYTVSQEDGSSNQLIYVPFHKATASLGYSFRQISAYYRYLYNGKVFYTSDNQSQIDAYNVSGLGVEYNFNLINGLTVGAQVLNLFDAEYVNVVTRPLPGRNYNMYLNFKF